MKIRKIAKTLAILMATLTIMSCSNIKTKDNNDVEENAVQNDNGDIVLNLWSHYGGLEAVISAFEKENPGIKVNVKTFTFEEYELEYKKSLIKDVGDADMFIIDSNNYGAFNSIKGLENLLKPEYTASQYKDDFDPELWELGKSLDKKELLGLPLASAPIVTYYRADILEKYGYPTDPKELAEFMKDPNNWLEMGKKLSENGISTVQWVGEIVRISTSNMPYFNEKLEYQRDNEEFEKAVSIAKKASFSGLSAFTDIWSEKGAKMLKEDKFAMLYLGSWGANDLKARVPEQSGKWRVTSLPFGVYGWNNASILSIAENSKNKEAAWKFVEFYNFKYNTTDNVGSVAGYLPFRNDTAKISNKNEFLGGQEEQQLYEDIMSKTKEYSVTPLDDKSFKLWDKLVNAGIDEDQTTQQIMDNIRSAVNTDFIKEKEIILNGNKTK